MAPRVFFVILCVLVSCGVWAQGDSLATDVPQAGEGIGAFLLRNGYNPTDYKEEFININKSRLGKDNMLKLGLKYYLPKKDDSRVEILFGEACKRVKVESDVLKGATYYLVSGHGGPDPGAMGKYNGKDLCEDEYAYDIMLRLARILMSMNATVHIIIQDPNDGIRDDAVLELDNDETCMGEVIPLDQIQRLNQRCRAINDLYSKERSGYCRAVFMHLDSRSENKRIDIFLYHYTKSVKGERLANIMRDKFDEKYKKHQPNRGFTGTVSERHLYVLKESNPPAVFLELGNIQNSQDLQRFLKSSNREAVAKWMAEGLVEDYVKYRR